MKHLQWKPINDNENTTPKRKRGKRKSKNDDVVTASKDVSKSQDNQIIHEEIQRVWNAINNLNTMLSELTSRGKELPDQNETISVTIANRFQVLDKFNDENLSNTNGCQRIAEVKRVTSGKTEYEEVKERFYEEKRKVIELGKRLQDRENSISELRVQ